MDEDQEGGGEEASGSAPQRPRDAGERKPVRVDGTDWRSTFLLGGSVLSVGLFWAAAIASRLFVDQPFSYISATGWVQNLAESTARFPNRQESAFIILSTALLSPALVMGALWVVRRFRDPFEQLAKAVDAPGWQVALLLSVVAAGGAAFVSFGLVQGAHLIDDERAYLFQAEAFARGKLAYPGVPAAFGNAMFLTSPVWTAKYPPGQALALLPGVLLGEPRVVPILVTALSVLGVFQLMRNFGERQALLAAALLAFSPFTWAVGGTLMAFSTHACAFVWFLAFLARAEDRTGPASPALAGAALGWCGLTRPYDAVALSLPVLAWLTWRTIQRHPRAARNIMALACGAAPFVALQLWYNRALTGSISTFPYFAIGGFHIGFTRTFDWFPFVHDPLQAAGHFAVACLRLDGWLLGYPASLVLVLLGLLRPDAQAWDRVLAACTASFVLFYALIPSAGTWDVGPTYYFAVAPILVGLAVRGVHWVRAAANERWPAIGHFASAFTLVGLVVALASVVPLRFVRLAALAGEIRKPWDAIAESAIGDAIVVLPPYKERLAAGYALGFPYEVPTGPSTRARLIAPNDEAELKEARSVLGSGLPVYYLMADQALFELEGQRRFKVLPFQAP